MKFIRKLFGVSPPTPAIDYKKREDLRSEDSRMGKQDERTKHGFLKWRTIKLGTFQNVGALKKVLKKSGFIVNERANNIMDKPTFTISSEEKEVDLVVASIKELGFKKNTHYDVLCARIEELGYALCPAEVGPYLRIQYPDQESGELWMFIAMKPMMDLEGDLNVFRITSSRSQNFFLRKKSLELSLDYSRWHGNPNVVPYPDGKLIFLHHG